MGYLPTWKGAAATAAAYRLRPWQAELVAELPERIQSQIAAADETSERLIGWVQLALALTLAMLYLIAPRPADAGMARLAPVPAALLLYAGFTIVRIALAQCGQLGTRFICASVVADILLLLGLIWAIHIQYGQPAAFSLKVPTFVYIFVVIALRSLRTDPRYVLLAGMTAAGGWLILTIAAVRASPPGIVTRSFTDYLNHNAILIGAEVDKVAAIFLVTGVLALGLARTRQTLISSVREGTAVREVSRFLSDGVARTIADAPQEVSAGKAVARDAAILMLDLRGFTRLTAELRPEQVVDALVTFHAEVVPIVRRHGGVIDKFLGDGVMATFGAVAPSPTAAADALRALDEVMDRASSVLSPLHGDAKGLDINGAVTAGPVVFAAVGTANRLEYTVIGAAVNIAAKLEKHNKAENTRALTTYDTYRLALDQGYPQAMLLRKRDRSMIAGLEHSLDLVVVRPAQQ